MKVVGIAELKAHLSEHLRRVKRGHKVLVQDRGTPVAVIHPVEDRHGRLSIRRATRPLSTLRFAHSSAGEAYDVEEIVRDRRGRG